MKREKTKERESEKCSNLLYFREREKRRERERERERKREKVIYI